MPSPTTCATAPRSRLVWLPRNEADTHRPPRPTPRQRLARQPPAQGAEPLAGQDRPPPRIGAPAIDHAATARALKALSLPLAGPDPLDEAISTAGQVAREALDDGLMLSVVPGVFCRRRDAQAGTHRPAESSSPPASPPDAPPPAPPPAGAERPCPAGLADRLPPRHDWRRDSGNGGDAAARPDGDGCGGGPDRPRRPLAFHRRHPAPRLRRLGDRPRRHRLHDRRVDRPARQPPRARRHRHRPVRGRQPARALRLHLRPQGRPRSPSSRPR